MPGIIYLQNSVCAYSSRVIYENRMTLTFIIPNEDQPSICRFEKLIKKIVKIRAQGKLIIIPI